MSKRLPKLVRDNLEKCRAAAIAAVEAYNRPSSSFRTAQFIVLIVIAWTALFHAICYKKGIKPWYLKKTGRNSKGNRYFTIDGDPKHWELGECVRKHFSNDNQPERKNLEFLIGLRDKIEHRHLPSLDAGLYGECQASLINLEDLLTTEFGEEFGLSEQLAVSLQFSKLIPSEKKRAAKELATGAAKTVKEYVERFRAGLPSSTLNSMKYSFNVYLVPKLGNRLKVSDTVVEFIQFDDRNETERADLEKLNVIIKEKHVPIVNHNLLKPTKVKELVEAIIPFEFTLNAHADAWRFFKVRPQPGASKPELTDPRYCVYDPVHNDYVYTDAWVKKLCEVLSSATKFREVIGRDPVRKPTVPETLN